MTKKSEKVFLLVDLFMIAEKEMVERIRKEIQLIQENRGVSLHIILEEAEKKKKEEFFNNNV